MPHKKSEHSDRIAPLSMNGLEGRMLYMTAPQSKPRDILLVYGHLSTLERWWDIAQELNQYGAVTIADLPGFGGMESFYKIGEKPTIDNLADYLAAFVKLRYKRKKVTIIGVSFGFVVVTRMLQRYPALVSKVELVVSLGGFTHKDDLLLNRGRYLSRVIITNLFSKQLPAVFFKNICLHPAAIRLHNRRSQQEPKKGALSKTNKRAVSNFQIHLWRRNDIRTYMFTMGQVLRLNNCDKPVNVPVAHIDIQDEKRLNSSLVEQHLLVIYKNCTMYTVTQYSPLPLPKTPKQRGSYFPRKLTALIDA